MFGWGFPSPSSYWVFPHFKKPPYVWHIFGIGILFDMLYSELNLVELYDWLQMLLGSAGAWLPPANGFHVSTAVGQWRRYELRRICKGWASKHRLFVITCCLINPPHAYRMLPLHRFNPWHLKHHVTYVQWEVQDPKTEVLYHRRQYICGDIPLHSLYIGLIYASYLH